MVACWFIAQEIGGWGCRVRIQLFCKNNFYRFSRVFRIHLGKIRPSLSVANTRSVFWCTIQFQQTSTPMGYLEITGVCSFRSNFSERQVLWSLCSVDFHTLTLQLPIPSFCEFTSNFSKNEHTPERTSPCQGCCSISWILTVLHRAGSVWDINLDVYEMAQSSWNREHPCVSFLYW